MISFPIAAQRFHMLGSELSSVVYARVSSTAMRMVPTNNLLSPESTRELTNLLSRRNMFGFPLTRALK